MAPASESSFPAGGGRAPPPLIITQNARDEPFVCRGSDASEPPVVPPSPAARGEIYILILRPPDRFFRFVPVKYGAAAPPTVADLLDRIPSDAASDAAGVAVLADGDEDSEGAFADLLSDLRDPDSAISAGIVGGAILVAMLDGGERGCGPPDSCRELEGTVLNRRGRRGGRRRAIKLVPRAGEPAPLPPPPTSVVGDGRPPKGVPNSALRRKRPSAAHILVRVRQRVQELEATTVAKKSEPPSVSDSSDHSMGRSRRRRRGMHSDMMAVSQGGTARSRSARGFMRDESRSSSAFRSLVFQERWMDWASSLRRLDPRYKILRFFEDVARDGGVKRGVISMRCSLKTLGPASESRGFRFPAPPGGPVRRRERNPLGTSSAVLNPQLQSPLLRSFNCAGVFTVWRPCSADAIRAMMTGDATGKGLDVKGKSSKGGMLSGYVPFVQIHDEADKGRVTRVPDGFNMRAFYASEESREEAASHLEEFAGRCREEDDEMRAEAAARGERDERRHEESCRADWLPPRRGGGGRGGGSTIRRIDDYSGGEADEKGDVKSKPAWGLECPQSLFWSGMVLSRPIGREERSGLDTGRPSEPAFQDMNLKALRIPQVKKRGEDSSEPGSASSGRKKKVPPATKKDHDSTAGPTAVVWQPPDIPDTNGDPLDPRTLLVAYEERGRVLPVVSDFDCFTVGTRGVSYDRPLPANQVELLRWSVEQIRGVLDDAAERRRRVGEEEREKKASEEERRRSAGAKAEATRAKGESYDDVEEEAEEEEEYEHVHHEEAEEEEEGPSWTSLWLDVLKRAARDPSKNGASEVPIPRYGYGDGTSYEMMGLAVRRFECGAVRHGAECFNYKFPQELDDAFLVVCDTLATPENPVPWRYVSERELTDILRERIEEGFAFPVNPKWVLADGPGWKDLYDRLLASGDANARRAMDVWFPPDSGIRERIEEICDRHPRGFDRGGGTDERAGTGSGAAAKTTMFGTEAMDLAELQLRRYLVLQRAKKKIRTALVLRRSGLERAARRSQIAEEEVEGELEAETSEEEDSDPGELSRSSGSLARFADSPSLAN